LSRVLNQIADRTLKKEELRKKIEEDFSLIPVLIEGVSSTNATVRYSCGGTLMYLSEKHPQMLYPYMDEFTKLLDSKYRILTWNAIITIANLAKVDDKQKLDDVFEKYFSLLNNDYMVTVANVVGNAGKIVLAKPYLADKIARELLKTEHIGISPHLTEECKGVIFEKTIQSLSQFFNKLNKETKVDVCNFVKKQLHSSRDTLRKEAELFLERWSE
jgi:hypothetical protein